MTSRLILVVEDDPILRDLTKRQLTKLGCETILVVSGEDALVQDCSEISLILMDIGLPGIDGNHATMLIREKELHERRKRVPIIALTGHSDQKQTQLAGMDDFLQKPAMLGDIKAMIEKWLPRNDHFLK